jgi:hypothetical protein
LEVYIVSIRRVPTCQKHSIVDPPYDRIVKPFRLVVMLVQRLLPSIFLFIIALFAFCCNSQSQDGTRNFDRAYVEHYNDSTMITIFGKRSLMVHDPVSLFKKDKYYVDSVMLIVPGKTGFFKPNEISMIPRGGYPFVKGGIFITDDSVKVELFYDDYDDKEIKHFTYSGNYKYIGGNKSGSL